MDEIVKDFLIESAENLDRLDQDLVKLEVDPSSKELLASIFRTIHTIKGSCGFLGFARLERLAHAGESLLSKLRDGELTLTADITSALLSMVDGVRQMLAQIESTEKDGDDDHAALIGHLTELQNGGQTPATEHAASFVSASQGETSAQVPPTDDARLSEKPDPIKIGGVLIEQGKIRPEDLASALELQELGRRKIGEILVAQGAVRPEDVAAAQQAVQLRNPDSPVETIRVGVNLLDRLMNLVGELVLARNQLLQFSNSTQDTAFQAVSQRMNLIATELQEEVMKTRMQPIGNIWNKFPRTGSRPRSYLRERSPARNGRPGDRAGQHHYRSNQGPADSPGSQLHRPWHRDFPRRVSRQARSRGGPAETACFPRRRPGQYRNYRRRCGSRCGEDAAEGHRTRARFLATGGADDQSGHLQHDFARFLNRRDGHQGFGSRRGHGRGQDQHREDRGHGRRAISRRARVRLFA